MYDLAVSAAAMTSAIATHIATTTPTATGPSSPSIATSKVPMATDLLNLNAHGTD